MTGQELKSRILDERERLLCHNCKWRYCPTYDCGLLDKCKELTDRQWDNIAKKENEAYDGIWDVPYEVMKRKVKKLCNKKN
jgi:hypothetical protein